MSDELNKRIMLSGRDEISLAELKVKRPCMRCYPDVEVEDIDPVLLVSVSGTVHQPGESGMTRCGVDATGPLWWWRAL